MAGCRIQHGAQTYELLHGDCVTGMKALPAGSADVVVTSPPYNLGIQYSQYQDDLPREEYLSWTREWAAACRHLLAPDGSLFLNVGSKPRDPWIALEVAQVFRGDFVLQNTIHWIKSIAVESTAGEIRSHGHYKPIHSRRFLNDAHEYIFHFTLSGSVELDRLSIGVPYQDKSNVERWAGKADLRCRGNTWFIPYETIKSREQQRPHPATFPVLLAENCLRLHGLDRIRLAVDPFLGLGSTAVACARLGVSFLGFEIDQAYLRIACHRIQDALRPPSAKEDRAAEEKG